MAYRSRSRGRSAGYGSRNRTASRAYRGRSQSSARRRSSSSRTLKPQMLRIVVETPQIAPARGYPFVQAEHPKPKKAKL